MVVTETRLEGVRLLARGKVRDIYDLGDSLLFIATDRISAFDYIMATGIPDKGKVLTQISLFWFRMMEDLIPHHVLSTDVRDYPPDLQEHADVLRDRSMLVRKLEMFPVECVARGYLAGSGWKEYRQQGTVCGLPLPAGLQQADRLPETIFTPATKAESGHDENIPFETMVEMVGQADAERLRELTVAIYERGARYARSRGILLADTKFEFGRAGGELVLADEVLTPDSSRFWDVETYRPGISPPSYDKQYLRDYLEKIGWEKQPPVPGLPEEIVAGIRDRYLEIYRKLTGGSLSAETG
jgi:phosphoribosylaminoimidazole-succinocarboxamide synthase